MRTITLILILIISGELMAQTNNFKAKTDSIVSLFDNIIKAKTDKEKIDYNNILKNLFKDVLKSNESFNYSFLELKHISKLKSNDNLLKIYTWNIPYENGEFEYFGFIQYKNGNNIKLIELNDKSKKIKNPENKLLYANNWYGALYYKILTNTYKDNTYYTLLAWDGNDNFTNKKIIEIISIKHNKLQFGSPIIKLNENNVKKRLIFEYSEQAKMLLRFDKNINMIVFDHLAPSQKKFTGQYMYYGPDMSQDGLLFNNGFWILKENLDLRNQENNKKKKPIKTSF